MSTRNETAEAIAAAINAHECYAADAWRDRVYVSRKESRGRRGELGHLTVTEDGLDDRHLTHDIVTLRKIAESVTS